MEASTVFHAFVTRRPEGHEEVTRIALGKRRSVNGRAEIRIGLEEPVFHGGAVPGASTASIQLLTCAVVPGPNGGWMRGLDPKSLAALIGDEVKVSSAFSSFHPVAGWSGKWALPKEQVTGISAGSVLARRVRQCEQVVRLAKEGGVRGPGPAPSRGFRLGGGESSLAHLSTSGLQIERGRRGKQ